MSIITIHVSIMSIGALHGLPRPTTTLYIFSSLRFFWQTRRFCKTCVVTLTSPFFSERCLPPTILALCGQFVCKNYVIPGYYEDFAHVFVGLSSHKSFFSQVVAFLINKNSGCCPYICRPPQPLPILSMLFTQTSPPS